VGAESSPGVGVGREHDRRSSQPVRVAVLGATQAHIAGSGRPEQRDAVVVMCVEPEQREGKARILNRAVCPRGGLAERRPAITARTPRLFRRGHPLELPGHIRCRRRRCPLEGEIGPGEMQQRAVPLPNRPPKNCGG
jgi:hypothetical protein